MTNRQIVLVLQLVPEPCSAVYSALALKLVLAHSAASVESQSPAESVTVPASFLKKMKGLKKR